MSLPEKFQAHHQSEDVVSAVRGSELGYRIWRASALYSDKGKAYFPLVPSPSISLDARWPPSIWQIKVDNCELQHDKAHILRLTVEATRSEVKHRCSWQLQSAKGQVIRVSNARLFSLMAPGGRKDGHSSKSRPEPPKLPYGPQRLFH